MENKAMATVNFRTEKGGVSNKTRNAIKGQASVAVGNVLDMGNLTFEYIPEKGAFCAHVANDAKTGEAVYVVLDMSVTDMHPLDRAKRASRAGKSKANTSTKVEVPELF